MLEDFKVTMSYDEDSFPLTFEEWLNLNCKMSPIKHMETKYNNTHDTQMYLSDFLGGKTHLGKKLVLEHHQVCRPVFISAPTGSGKNYYLVHDILGPLMEQPKKHGKILLLSNRVALGRQTKLDIAKFIRDRTGNAKYEKTINDRTDAGLDEIHDFGDIILYSYQQISKQNNIDFLKNNITYVIFDECHFFTSDAAFNPSTGSILETLVKNFQNMTRLYMSSTMETVFEPIIRTEVNYYQDISDTIYKADKRLFFSYYDMSRHYDYLNIKSWKENNDIVKKIADSKDKWLIFVDSISKGKELETIIKKKCTTYVQFINANSKNEKTYSYIIQNEHLPNDIQVLITTAVIDNGVNLKDDTINNIVIDVPDRVEFIQMLGRLRINKEKYMNKVTLFIHDFDLKYLVKTWQKEARGLINRWNYKVNGNIPREENSQFLEIVNAHINPLSMYQILARMDDLRRMIIAINPDTMLVLNDSEKDLQLKMFNYYYDRNNEDVLGRRICNALRDVRKGHLNEREADGKIYPILSEKSFLQLIQEKRAASLEHDAVDFIEKYTKYNYNELKKKRRSHNTWEVPTMHRTQIQDWNDKIYPEQMTMRRTIFYNEWTEAMRISPQDKIVDAPWDDDQLWDKLEPAYSYYSSSNPDKEQPIPDSEYMKIRCELYRSLAKNHLGNDRPVLMEQLHWLDIDSLDRIDDELKTNKGQTFVSDDTLNMVEVSNLLNDKAYLYNEVQQNKQDNKWILQHGYSLKLVLKNIEKGNLYGNEINQQYDKNNHQMIPQNKLWGLFKYLKKFYKINDDKYTFQKLTNLLSKTPYKFQADEKDYEFTITSIPSREDGERATYYVFTKKEVCE